MKLPGFDSERMLPARRTDRAPKVGDKVEARAVGTPRTFTLCEVIAVNEHTLTATGCRDWEDNLCGPVGMRRDLEGRDWRWP